MCAATVISSSSSGDLTRRSSLTSGVAVDEPRAGQRVLQLEHRLAPGARADRRSSSRRRARASPSRKSARPSSVSLTVIRSSGSSPQRWNSDEHARQDEQRLAAGHDERAGDPAVRVGALAEARQVALEAGQVLEVRRRRHEQRVDPLLLHPLGELLAARGVFGLGQMCTSRGGLLRSVALRGRVGSRPTCGRRRGGRAAAPRRCSGRRRTGSADGTGSRSAAGPDRAPRRAAPRAGSPRRRRAGSPRRAPRCTGAAAPARARASARSRRRGRGTSR